jgi:hypothetical protein
MAMLTGNEDPMIMVIWFEFAGLLLIQDAFEVIWQETTFPFAGVQV